jgi:hypothetical protein
MNALVSESASDVIVLGAGFSKAISMLMPDTDELGNAVLRQLSDSPMRLPERFTGGHFETWLSRIAEDQPDLSVSENLANRALFQRCSEALTIALNASAAAATEEARSHAWFRRFLGTLHSRRATVITFNQDILIEATTESAGLYSWGLPVSGRQEPILWHHLLGGQPPLPPGRWGVAPQPTFRLLKLHGSTNWFWQAGDMSGATVARWFLPGTVSPQEAVPDEAAALRQALPGRVPLIVPPSASKSAFYQTPILAQLWQDARTALSAETVRVSLVGYSLPLTDLVTSGMLQETLFERATQPPTIDIVNLEVANVRNRLIRLGADANQITGVDSVSDFALQFEQRAAADLVEQFRQDPETDIDRLMLVGSSIAGGMKVIEIRAGDGGDLELHLEDARPPYSGTGVQRDDAPPALGVGRLLQELRRTSTKRMSAVTPNGGRHLIVGAAGHVTKPGAGNGRFQVLITAEAVDNGNGPELAKYV